MKRAKSAPLQYAVIQAAFRNGKKRTFFASEADAEAEGCALLERRKTYPNYTPPNQFVIVKVVGVIEVSSKRRALSVEDTAPAIIEIDPQLSFNCRSEILPSRFFQVALDKAFRGTAAKSKRNRRKKK